MGETMGVPAAQRQAKQKLIPHQASARQDHEATSNVADADSEDYRELTRQEVLNGIARGYAQALAGEYEPIEELIAELE